MPWVKTVHVLDRAATVIGFSFLFRNKLVLFIVIFIFLFFFLFWIWWLVYDIGPISLRFIPVPSNNISFALWTMLQNGAQQSLRMLNESSALRKARNINLITYFGGLASIKAMSTIWKLPESSSLSDNYSSYSYVRLEKKKDTGNRLTDGSEVSLTRRPPFTPSNDLIGNWTRDLPSCSTVIQAMSSSITNTHNRHSAALPETVSPADCTLFYFPVLKPKFHTHCIQCNFHGQSFIWNSHFQMCVVCPPQSFFS
jgi:hypothetical protein